MPKHKIFPSTRFFPHKERYEIFDVNENLVEKFKIFGQDFVPIRTALLWAWNWNFDILRIQQIQPSSNNEKIVLSCPCYGDGYWNFEFLEIWVTHEFGSA